MPGKDRYFSCTQCGRCCNRSPEVELSESIALSGAFIFRLMFRPYEMANSIEDHAKAKGKAITREELQTYIEQKKTLELHAGWSYRGKSRFAPSSKKVIKYIYISAIAMDYGGGRCAQLGDGGCAIYERRPLSCRTAPFHYSFAEAELPRRFDQFVNTLGYECRTTESDRHVLSNGKLVDSSFLENRRLARLAMTNDAQWKKEIARRVVNRSEPRTVFPGKDQIERNSAVGSSTISIHHAWKVALDLGIIDGATYATVVRAQARLISLELARRFTTPKSNAERDYFETLIEMADEYRLA